MLARTFNKKQEPLIITYAFANSFMSLLLLLLIKLKVRLNVSICHFLVLMPCYHLCMSNKGI
jgi:hypothetical protein